MEYPQIRSLYWDLHRVLEFDRKNLDNMLEAKSMNHFYTEWSRNASKMIKDIKSSVEAETFTWATSSTPKEGSGYHNRHLVVPLNSLARDVARAHNLQIVDYELILLSLVSSSCVFPFLYNANGTKLIYIDRISFSAPLKLCFL